MNKKARRFAQLLLAMVFLITAMLGFPRTAAAANPPVPLSSLAPGTVVNFAGYNWIVLDPGTGYLLMQGFYGNNQPFTDMSDLSGIITPNIFDPNNTYNIAYYLNQPGPGQFIGTGFYQYLSNNYPEYIPLVQEHSWNVGGIDQNGNGSESSSTVNARIGLLSYREWESYSQCCNPSSGFLSNPSSIFWTITPIPGSFVHWNVYTSGSLLYSSMGNGYAVRPALYLNPDVLISGGSVTTQLITASSLRVTSTGNSAVGAPVTMTVTAIDSNGRTVQSYTGTVHFTSSDTNSPVLPQDYTFTGCGSGKDNGTHVFTDGVTLNTVGPQTVTATDTTTGSITGTVDINVLTVTGISPTSGPVSGGTAVTVTGHGFIGATGVSFGSVAAASFTVNSDTSITAISPAQAAGTVDVTVTTLGGTSATALADKFTYSTNELVGWWKLGEGSGTAAADSSGYGDNGTLTNPVWSTDHTPDITDQVNASLDFSGGGSSFTAPLPTTATGNVSISAWVKWNGATGVSDYQPIAYVGNPGKNGYGLFLDSSGKLEVLLGGVAWLPTTAALTANTWQQVALVGVPSGGTENWTIYLNGIQVSQVSGNPVASVPGDNMLIGFTSNATSTAPHFPGLLDDVRIYTTALTPAQVQQLAGTVVTGIGPAGGPVNGGTAVTITGYNFTGATGVSFGGTPAASFTVNSDTSITAVSPAGSGAVDVTVTTQNGTSVNGPGDRFTYGPVPVVTGVSPISGPVSGGTAVTVTGHGFIGATGVSFGSVAAASFTVNSDTSITAISPAQAAGTVDVTVTTLSGTSATALADKFTYSTNELVGWWKLGEGSGTAAADSSGYGDNGTLTNPVWSTDHTPDITDQVNASLDFSGGGSSFTAPLPTTATGNVSISAWVKWNGATGVSDYQPIAYVGNPGKNGYGLFLDSSGKLEVLLGGVAWLPTTAALTANTWQQVALVGVPRGGTENWTIYLNGIQVNQVSGNPVASVPGDNMLIGFTSNATSTAPHFPGLLDDVRIYTTALTPAQVQQLAGTVVTGIGPAGGSVNGDTAVTITGYNFTGATGVSFGGTPAASFTVNSDTSITAVSPAGSGAVDVTVTTQNGTSVTGPGDRFTYVPVPVVTGITPASGKVSGGTTVTITGYNFTGATGVSFGGTSATSFTVNSDTSITATAPAHATGTAEVTVTNAYGTSTGGLGTIFTYSTNELAGWWKLGEGSGTTAVDWSGYGHHGTVTSPLDVGSPPWWVDNDYPNSIDRVGGCVDFSGGDSSFTAPIPTTNTGDVSISAWVKWDGTTWGDGSIHQPIAYNGTLDAGNGYGLALTNLGYLEVISGGAWLATATKLTPNTWQHVAAVEDGSGKWTVYLNGTQVGQVNTTPATPTGYMYIGYLTVQNTMWKFPGRIDNVRIYTTALTAAQVQQLAATFPVVTGVSPTSGSTVGGTTMTITGSGFTGATGVSFGGTAATSFTVNSDTSITAISPAHATGTVDVTVTTALGGTSAAVAADRFIYVQVPSITGVSPSVGPAAGGTVVTITGSSFTGTTGVSFGGTAAASFTVNSDASITAVSPAHADGTVDVTVTTPGGTSAAVSADRFTYSTNELVGWWKLGEGSGTTAADSSGYGYNGTLTNSVWSTDCPSSVDQIGASLDFSGGNSSFTAPIPTAATANVSISAWVKWNGKTASNYQPIVYNGNPGADGYGLFVDSNGNLEVLLGGIAWLDTTVHLTPNTWQQVGLVGVPASGTENWTVYLNANPVATVSGIPKAPASSDKMLIGYATNATSTATYFPGLIDDVRLYATALSSAQIEQLAAVYPVVTGVSPATGSVNGGSVVNITGSDFTGATGVDFGSVAAASFAVNSDTSITATAPAGSGTVDVTVTAPGGTSAAGPGDQFTYLSTAKDITAFSVAGQVGSSTIDLINHAVIFHMPYGTDVSALNPSITVSANAAVSPTSGTAEDFSNPVIYTVTAPDNSSQNWSVTCLIDTVTHTVAVSANPAVDGTVSGGGTYAEGASVTVTASVYSGYTFVNWTEGGSQVSTSAAFVFTMGTADRTLVANFAAIPTYTVTYSGNGSSGGSVPTDSNNYTTGAAITVLGNTGSLVKTGSTFAGWNTAADGIGTSYAAGATLTMGSANVTMYAQWTANPPLTHTVSVSSNPPAGGTVSGGGTYAEGASVTVMATPNSGYNFVNWTENGSAVSTIAAYTFTLGTADRTLAANFAAIPPVITTGTISGTVSDGTNPLAGATVSLTVSGSVYSATTAGDGSYAILNVPAGTGYTVTANLTGYTGANATNVNVTANTTTSGVNLTLSVIPPTIYTVSIASLTDGSITASPSTAAEGTAINLTITPDAGMQLKAGTLQYNDGTTDHLISGTSFTMPAANVTVSAQFEAIPPAPTLTVLTLSGSIPDLTVGQAVYDLNNLSLNGTDQYGAPFSLSGQTVQWNLASGNAYAGLTGSLLTPLAAGSGTVTATVYGVASNPLGFTVMAPRFSGGGGGSANTPSPTPTTVTGNVTDGTTGAKVSSVTATVTTGSNDNDTVSMSAGQLAVLKQPDGTISPLSDLSHVAITCATGTPVPIFSDGTIQMADLAKGTDNNFNITCDLGHGQKITIATMQIKIDSSGNVTLSVVLIDPYGIITDARTGKALAGVNVTLYYADTGRNKAAGKTADTVVALPGIAGFKPNNNQDPQTSDSSGAYGFMVFPTTDYYIIATKDGYAQYTSPTISVEQEIVHWDFKMSPTLSGVTRLAGRSRVDTALAIAQAEYPGKIANAVLATADNYPDALTGSVLAYKVNAPILLVGSSAADQAKVLGYLKSSLDPAGTVYIMGGTAAVGSAMESQVAASGFSHIIRIAGADRYQTSAEIADQLAVKAGTPLVLVSGENYPDALSVSSVAAQMQLPILLVQRDRISNSVRQEISAIKPGKVYIIGGEGVISAAVENQVAQLTGLAQTNIVRIGGTDRYATSLAVAQYFNLTGQNVCIATGGNFPDALAGSVYAANHNAPIILVGSSLTDQAITYLKTRKLTGAAIFGGEAVVSKDIEQQLQQLIKKGGNPK